MDVLPLLILLKIVGAMIDSISFVHPTVSIRIKTDGFVMNAWSNLQRLLPSTIEDIRDSEQSNDSFTIMIFSENHHKLLSRITFIIQKMYQQEFERIS